jgi:DNA-3-methyladenine glycosylase II
MTTSFILYPIPPFRLDYTVWALRRRDKNIVDQWNGRFYTRLFMIDNDLIKVMLEQTNTLDDPKIHVTTNKKISKTIQAYLANQLDIMLGLKTYLTKFYAIAKKYSSLNSLVNQFMGLKPPRFPSVFEALVNAISCQQISLDAGLQIQNRLVQYINLSLNDKDMLYAFPRPVDVANCTVANLKKIGYSRNKSETLIQLASKIVEDKSIFNDLEKRSNKEIIDFLCQFKGIGRWSAEYVLLRGLGKIDTFPGDDVGAQKNLQELLHINKKLDYKNISEITKKWYPYAGLIYFHLLLYKLQQKGML